MSTLQPGLSESLHYSLYSVIRVYTTAWAQWVSILSLDLVSA